MESIKKSLCYKPLKSKLMQTKPLLVSGWWKKCICSGKASLWWPSRWATMSCPSVMCPARCIMEHTARTGFRLLVDGMGDSVTSYVARCRNTQDRRQVFHSWFVSLENQGRGEDMGKRSRPSEITGHRRPACWLHCCWKTEGWLKKSDLCPKANNQFLLIHSRIIIEPGVTNSIANKKCNDCDRLYFTQACFYLQTWLSCCHICFNN